MPITNSFPTPLNQASSEFYPAPSAKNRSITKTELCPPPNPTPPEKKIIKLAVIVRNESRSFDTILNRDDHFAHQPNFPHLSTLLCQRTAQHYTMITGPVIGA